MTENPPDQIDQFIQFINAIIQQANTIASIDTTLDVLQRITTESDAERRGLAILLERLQIVRGTGESLVREYAKHFGEAEEDDETA